MQPTIGRVLHYRLSTDDINRILLQRAKVWSPRGNPLSHADAGTIVPLIVSRVWPDEFGPEHAGVNGQLILDGGDTLWVTSVGEGADPGTWTWPPKV